MTTACYPDRICLVRTLLSGIPDKPTYTAFVYRLFVYPDSSDLYDVETELVNAFEEFVREWEVEGVLLTNKKAPLMAGQELPDWNIGLRVETERLKREDVDQLLLFISQLSRKVNLPFVLGTWDRASIRDLCFVDRHIPDGAGALIMRYANAV